MLLCIDGSKRCAITYINDPRNTIFEANVEFVEMVAPEILGATDLQKGLLGMVRFLILIVHYGKVHAYACADIHVGHELFVNYYGNFKVPAAPKGVLYGTPASPPQDKSSQDATEPQHPQDAAEITASLPQPATTDPVQPVVEPPTQPQDHLVDPTAKFTEAY